MLMYDSSGKAVSNWSYENPRAAAIFLSLLQAIAEIAAHNDGVLARHLKRPVVDLPAADRAEIDRELQYELNFQKVV